MSFRYMESPKFGIIKYELWNIHQSLYQIFETLQVQSIIIKIHVKYIIFKIIYHLSN